jgi:hypothetical protein
MVTQAFDTLLTARSTSTAITVNLASISCPLIRTSTETMDYRAFLVMRAY